MGFCIFLFYAVLIVLLFGDNELDLNKQANKQTSGW